MSNLYEFTNQFRLYDVDGVILASPNDFILIREPAGFRGVDITLSRDDDTHGVFYEFSGEETTLGFDRVKIEDETFSPYELIKGVLGAVGVDGKLIFRFYNFDVGLNDWVLQYEGDIDLEFSIILDYKIDSNVKRITLGDLFKTRKDVPVNFAAKETIDGDSITGIEPVDMFLHSKIRRFETETNFLVESISQADTTSPVNTLYCNVAFSETPPIGSNNSTIEFISNSIKTFTSSFTTISETPNPFFELEEGGLLTVNNIKVSAELRHTISGGGDVTIGLYGRAGIDGEDVLIGSLIELFGVSGYVALLTVDEDDISFDIPIPVKGAKINFYLQIIITETSPNGGFKQIKTPDPLSGDPIEFDITFDAINNSSISEVYNPTDAFNQVLEVITNDPSVFISSFFTSFGDQIKLTNGYKIRDFADRNVIKSFKDLYDNWAKPVFGLGYTIFEPVPNVFKIKMERYEFFYQDVEVDFFETVIDGSFILEIDKDIIFNEISVGYKDFPRSTNENKGNNLDEFNTVQKLLTPIKSVKKKVDYISEAIGSGYLIENQRREQFKDVPSETVSNDEKLFCIDSVDNDTYTLENAFGTGKQNVIADAVANTLSLLGGYFDIRVGDSIVLDRIGGSSFLEGTYDIESVEIVGERTLYGCDSVTSSGSSDSEWDITLPESRLRAARNENFDSLTNVISPTTIYNAGINPKYMVKNHALIFNSGLNPKPDTAIITTQDAKLNDEMTCRFSTAQGEYNKDPQTTVEMGGNMELKDVQGYAKLFSGVLIKFKTNIGYNRVLAIRDAMLNQSTNNDNFGYLRVKDYEGNEHTGWIKSDGMTYNPLNQEVSFILKGRFVPTGSSFDYALDFGLN